jgi:hypothetical protein
MWYWWVFLSSILRCLKESVFNSSFYDSRQMRKKLRLLVAGFLLECLSFNPRVRHVAFVVDKATMGQAFTLTLRLLHQCSVLVRHHGLLKFLFEAVVSGCPFNSIEGTAAKGRFYRGQTFGIFNETSF